MFCPECGNQNPDTAKFCIKCGYNYSHLSSSVSSPPPQLPLPQRTSAKTSNNSLPIVAVIVSVLLLGVFGVVAFVVFQAWSDQQAGRTAQSNTATTNSNYYTFSNTSDGMMNSGYNTSSNKSYSSGNLKPKAQREVVETVEPVRNDVSSQDSEPQMQAQAQSIVSEAFSLKGGQYMSYKFTIPESSGGGTVVGNFVASGGSDDIFVVITNESGLTNIKSGNSYKAYYDSGKVSADDINVNLSPGTYYIVFSNAHSLMTPKAVNANVSVEY